MGKTKNNNNLQLPLVSVIVPTYNSAKYVISTLESVRNQTYDRIELIITDDGSKDETVSLCNAWLEKNADRFEGSNLVTVEKNTGISANLNRGVYNSHGDWIKGVAADDMFKEECISHLVEFVSNHVCDFCTCDIEVFCDDGVVDEKHIRAYKSYFDCVKEPVEKKRKRIIHEYKIPGPGWFFSRRLYDDVGGCEEKYKMLEEWPFIYKVLKKGYDLLPLEEKLILYRVSNSSVSHARDNGLIKRQLFLDKRNFFKETIRKELISHGFIMEAWSKTLGFFVFDKLYDNPKGIKRAMILSLRFLDPIEDWEKIKSLFKRK